MFYYLLFFFFLTTTFLTLDRQYVLKARSSFVITVAIFVTIIGLRYASVDYFTYRGVYELLSFANFGIPFFNHTVGTSGNEFVFSSIGSFLQVFNLPFTAFSLSIALLSVLIRFSVFRQLSPYFFLSVLFYLSTLFFKDLGQVRNALASAVLLLAVKPIYHRRLLPFLGIVIVAFGIQAFAIIALPLYFLFPLLRNRALVHGVLLFSLGIAISGGIMSYIVPILDDYSNVRIIRSAVSYFERNSSISLYFNLYNILNITLSFIIVHYRRALSTVTKYAPVLILFHVYATVVYLLAFDFTMVAGRINELLWLNAVALLVPMLITLFRGFERSLVFLAAAIYATGVFVSVSQGANPYRFVGIM